MKLTIQSYWAVLLSSLLMVSPVISYAQTSPTIVVPPMAGGESNRLARNAIVKALKSKSHLNVVEDEAIESYLRSHSMIQNQPRTTSEAEDLLKAGIHDYRELKMESAVSKLEKAKQRFRNALSEDGAFEGLRSAHFHLGMVYLAKRESSRAKEEFVQTLLLDPERKTRQLSMKLYPTDVRKSYEEARKTISQRPTADLRVLTDSGGEIVYVDGKSVGSAPVQVKDLPVGEHFVRVEAEGRDPFFAAKTLVAGSNQVSISLKPSAPKDVQKYFGTLPKGAQADHERASFLDEMGVALGADIFLFLSPQPGAVEAQLYDLRSQDISKVERSTSPDGLVEQLVNDIGRDGYVVTESTLPKVAKKVEAESTTPSKPLPSALAPAKENTLSQQAEEKLRVPNPPGEKKLWYENQWLWAAVALGVGAGVGSLLLFTDVGKKNASHRTLTVTVPGK